ncbi:MAG: DUF4124 domain-containing protein [Deltaproteobacteria bacterium]|nr:DUF4124 domain-containing protein [Deltaproteobacteria bacterium]
MSRGLVFAAAAAVFVWLAGAAPDAAAQKVYKWTDPDGKVHFSNVSPGGEGAAGEERPGGSPQGVEAESPATASSAESEAPPPRAAEPAAPEASGARAEVSDEDFSSKVSGTRLRLKRELAQAKEQAQAADDKLTALKKERDQPARMGIEILQKAYGPDQHASTEEEDLRKQKATADKRAEDIRKQYAELRAEAVKRYGGQPSWWLPIE